MQGRSAPHRRPARLPRRWRAVAFAWLTQTRQAQTPFVQERLLSLLPDGPPLTVMLVAWSVVMPAFCIALSGHLSAWLLLGVMVLLDIAVVRLQMLHANALHRKSRPPRQALLAARSAWFFGLACSAYLALREGDVALSVLATGVVMAFNGYAACRLAAFPRLATVLILVTWLGLALGLLASPQTELRLLCWFAPFGMAGMYTLMRLQHDLLVSGLQAHDANQRAARHDALTGLPNRRLLGERLAALCSDLAVQNAALPSFAVLVIDLDGFKAVNDTHGHEAGDRLLASVAQRMLDVVRTHDVVARWGGDEFTVLLSGVDEPAACETATRLIRAICSPTEIKPGLFHAGLASVGIAMAPQDGSPPHDLLKVADLALYAAKRAGKGRWASPRGLGEPTCSPP